MALIDIEAGHVGTVVTWLQMDRRPDPSVPTPRTPLKMARWEAPDPAAYRALFARVGSPWLWYSRLAMDDAQLAAAICEVHVVSDAAGAEAGMIELDLSDARTCLIRFLGLVPELAGQGHGAWLLDRVMELGWRPGVARLSVSTCSLDHPAALPAYLRAGFTLRRRAFESFPDPRLAGLLPRDVAPQVPF